MGSEDVRYFREAKRGGILSEYIYILDKAFVVDWREANIEDVRVLKRVPSSQ